MIKIVRIRTRKGLEGYTGSYLQKKLSKLLGYYYSDGATGKVSFKSKKRQVWRKAKPQLKKESHSKCAYCEADTAVVAHGDVEHFRPKSEYWWLAYCYDNYTFSCQVCNQVYKGDNFFVSGPKLPSPVVPPILPTDSNALAQLIKSLCPDPVTSSDLDVSGLFLVEDANLLNPYLNDPELDFSWDPKPATKEVWLVSNSTARSTRVVDAAVDMLGLNREELLRLRWNAYYELETLALVFQGANFTVEKRKDLLARVRLHASDDKPFAGMKRYFLREWGLLD
jgi:uncharacterized protein (TIGR02646 family)